MPSPAASFCAERLLGLGDWVADLSSSDRVRRRACWVIVDLPGVLRHVSDVAVDKLEAVTTHEFYPTMEYMKLYADLVEVRVR